MLTDTEVLVADECWIALALLHRGQPHRESFSAREIVARLRQEKIHPETRAGVQPHIYVHNVANAPPNSARYRMFYRLEDGTYRLFRPSDDYHPERHGKTRPDRADVPVRYHELLDWYEQQYCTAASRGGGESDLVLRMRGVGQEIWASEDGDTFVATLRAGWPDSDEGRGARSPGGQKERVWQRILAHQGEQFHTKTGLPFTYSVEGTMGLWFYRNNKRIEKRLWRGDLEKALARCPLENTTDISDCLDPSYLFGLLMDERIRDREW